MNIHLFSAAMRWGLVAAGIHAVTYLGLSAAVNAVGHTFGRRTYDNLARNNQWLAWVTAGEGLHNNHHAAPTSARLAHARGEIDPGWWMVRFLTGRGWAIATVASSASRAQRWPDRPVRPSSSPAALAWSAFTAITFTRRSTWCRGASRGPPRRTSVSVVAAVTRLASRA